jgi:hypothetical protein
MGFPPAWPTKEPVFERKVSIRVSDNATKKTCEIDVPIKKHQLNNDDYLNVLFIELYQKFDIILKEMFAPWQKSDPTKTIFGSLFLQALKTLENDSGNIDKIKTMVKNNLHSMSV